MKTLLTIYLFFLLAPIFAVNSRFKSNPFVESLRNSKELRDRGAIELDAEKTVIYCKDRGRPSIKQKFDYYHKSFLKTYNEYLVNNPVGKGTLTYRFIILSTGRVSKIFPPKYSMGNQHFEKQMAKQIFGWLFFDSNDAECEVEITITFTPPGKYVQ